MILKLYIDVQGSCPFDKWLNSIDTPLKHRILVRLKRIETNNLGDIKSCGLGISELRFFFGGGLRVYLGISKDNGIILLGGSKSSQKKRYFRSAIILVRLLRKTGINYEKKNKTRYSF